MTCLYRVAADGLCSIQLYLIGTVQRAHASLLEIAQAADLIYAKCVASDANLGGFALEIGKAKLATHRRMSSYLNLTWSQEATTNLVL